MVPNKFLKQCFCASYLPHFSELQRVFGALHEATMCEASLRGKAKQTGWPKHKESASQRHVAVKPSQSTSPPLLPSDNSEPLTLPPEPHKPFHIPRAKRRKDGGGGGANSDSYSLNVTTSQKGQHDTATKSVLMDSFRSPANMTGGVCVCVRVRGCGTRAGEGACLPRWRATWANESCVI